jgi:Fe-S oxidoreductase
MAWRDVPAGEFLVHGHCHQKSFGTFDDTLAALRAIPGATVAAVESGCCGMAGSFGYERAHYETSLAMGEVALLPSVRRAKAEVTVVAPGTSCRQQIAHGTGRQALHPAVALARALA